MPVATHHTLLALFDVGGMEMLLILVVVLLLFGGKRMPELARGIGKSINEFKKATSGVEAQLKQAIEEARETATAAMQEVEKPLKPVAPPPPSSPALAEDSAPTPPTSPTPPDTKGNA
jgi:sec-independent protein translocase protein TatA